MRVFRGRGALPLLVGSALVAVPATAATAAGPAADPTPRVAAAAHPSDDGPTWGAASWWMLSAWYPTTADPAAVDPTSDLVATPFPVSTRSPAALEPRDRGGRGGPRISGPPAEPAETAARVVLSRL